MVVPVSPRTVFKRFSGEVMMAFLPPPLQELDNGFNLRFLGAGFEVAFF